MFCAQMGSANNYLILFDLIEQQEVYDEGKIKRALAGHKFVKQLHVTKYYLRNLILKSLRNFHAQLSKDAVLKDILRNVEILFNKELLDLCSVEIKKAEKIAVTYERYTALVEIKAWQRRLSQALAPHDYAGFMGAMQQQQWAIEHLKNTNTYWQLAITTSRTTLDHDATPVHNEHLLTDPQNALSLESTVLHYNTLYFQHLRTQHYDEAEQTLYTLTEILEAHPLLINEDPGPYASTINNLVSYLVFQKKYEPALLLIQRAKEQYEAWKITAERQTLFKQIMRTYNIELEIYRDTRAFDENASFITGIEDFVTANRYKMPRSYLLSFWFQLANVFFMQKHFERSLKWLNEILNTTYRTTRIDLQIHARMMNLMIHLDQQNLFVLRYFVDSTRRFLKKQRSIAPHEKILLKFFSDMAQAPLLEYQERFNKLHTDLFPVNKKPLVSEGQDYIDYRAWIETHAF